MSIGPVDGLLPTGAEPLAHAGRAQSARASQEVAAQERSAEAAQQADNAEGVAAADGQDHDANQREADGRRPWERIARRTRKKLAPAADPAQPLEPPSDHVDLIG